ncbi:MAG: type I CRISPR-associated protein Cas7 [Thaumarchaeota archaeon]|nr:type I CRISPR-associated protein Cas7 [Nitrososphaerota archaeon]
MNNKDKKEILFYYESRQNPNGDPGFENQPRLMPDGTILVTDVRIKRTIRDHAKNVLGETLFVDYSKEDGSPTTADKRAKEIIGDLKGDVIAKLINSTFDTPLFGALVTIRESKDEDKSGGDSAKLTGPVQFGIGRSTNQVTVINPTISGRFVGKEKEAAQKQYSTFGKFYSVEYALIKIHGAVNPANLAAYINDEKITKKFSEKEEKLFTCLWDGTNQLITRSKYPQRSILFLEVTYDSTIYNDLPNLVVEKKEMKEKPTSLVESPFDFTKLIHILEKRRDKVKLVRVKGCEELDSDIKSLVTKLRAANIKVEEL